MSGDHDDGAIARVRSALHFRRRHGYESVVRSGEGLRTIGLLLGAVVVLLLVMIAVQQVETRRRTASTPIDIVSTELQLRSSYEQSPLGTWIRYVYVVDGSVYPGYDFRRWLDVASHEPKVCFDPENPGDHYLVNGSTRCGGDVGT